LKTGTLGTRRVESDLIAGRDSVDQFFLEFMSKFNQFLNVHIRAYIHTSFCLS
jgi:hypothetical protein